MIKIISFFEQKCEVKIEVEPTRHFQIYERELGEAVAKRSVDYHLAKDGIIYYSVGYIDLDHTLKRLKEMKEQAQEKFSQRIQKLRNEVDKFKLLQELTKKKLVKEDK